MLTVLLTSAVATSTPSASAETSTRLRDAGQFQFDPRHVGLARSISTVIPRVHLS